MQKITPNLWFGGNVDEAVDFYVSVFPLTTLTESTAPAEWFYTTLSDTKAYIIPCEEFNKQLKNTDGLTAYQSLINQAVNDQ